MHCHTETSIICTTEPYFQSVFYLHVKVREICRLFSIIDLNVEYEPLIHDFISQNSNYKVGFKHKQSDLLYNVQLDISKTQIAENGYQKILDLI